LRGLSVVGRRAGRSRHPADRGRRRGARAAKGGKPAGSFGRAAALSFKRQQDHDHLGGGMLLSDDLTLLAGTVPGYPGSPTRPHTSTPRSANNYRLSNLLAALGRAQLSRLDAMISRRREIRAQYVLGLSTSRPALPGSHRDGAATARTTAGSPASPWTPPVCPISVDTVIKSLDEEDIEARHL